MANIPLNINRLTEGINSVPGSGQADLNADQSQSNKTSGSSFVSFLHSLQEGKSQALSSSKTDLAQAEFVENSLKKTEGSSGKDLSPQELLTELLNRLHNLLGSLSDRQSNFNQEEGVKAVSLKETKEGTGRDLAIQESLKDILSNLQDLLGSVSDRQTNFVQGEGVKAVSLKETKEETGRALAIQESLQDILSNLQDLLGSLSDRQTNFNQEEGVKAASLGETGKLLAQNSDSKESLTGLLSKLQKSLMIKDVDQMGAKNLGLQSGESDSAHANQVLKNILNSLDLIEIKNQDRNQIIIQGKDSFKGSGKNDSGLAEAQKINIQAIKEMVSKSMSQGKTQLSDNNNNQANEIFSQGQGIDTEKNSLLQNHEQLSLKNKGKLQEIVGALKATVEEIGYKNEAKSSSRPSLFHGLENKEFAFFLNQGKESLGGESKTDEKNAFFKNSMEKQLQDLVTGKSLSHKGDFSKQFQSSWHGLNNHTQQQNSPQNGALHTLGQNSNHQSQSVNEGVPTGPSSTQNLLLTTEKGVVEQVFMKMSNAYRDGSRNILLQLHPPELGKLRIRLTSERGKIRAHLQSQNENVHDLLQKHLPRLRDSLEEQGIQVEDMRVDVDSDNSDSFYDRYAGGEDQNYSRFEAKKEELNDPEIPTIEGSLSSTQKDGTLSLRI